MIDKQTVLQYNKLKIRYYRSSYHPKKHERMMWKFLQEKYGGKWNCISDVVFNDPEIIFNFVHPIIGKLSREEFHVLHLNESLKLNCYEVLSIGGINSVKVDIGSIMTGSLLSGSSRVIVAHNHPTGSIKPSESDIDLTSKIVEACELFGRKLEEHLIVGKNDYFSLRASKSIGYYYWIKNEITTINEFLDLNRSIKGAKK